MSPSKKANKKTPLKKTHLPDLPSKSRRVPGKSARKTTSQTSARSSRVSTKKNEQPTPGLATQPQTHDKPPKSKFLTNVLRILALFAVVAITVFIYSIRERMEEFQAFGLWGVFFIAMFANATVLLPAPGVAVIYAMGGIFNPLGVGLAAGTGGAIGELSGYLAGFSGQAVIERTEVYSRIQPWVDQYGGWAIMVLSAIPNPFFDIAGIAAGIAKMPLRTFLIFTWVGQFIKMTLFALAGHYSITLLTNFIK